MVNTIEVGDYTIVDGLATKEREVSKDDKFAELLLLNSIIDNLFKIKGALLVK